MVKHLIALALAGFASTSALAVENVARPRTLSGPEIIAVLQLQTLQGIYADGTPFKETYRSDNLTDYSDLYRIETGNWSVVNNLFCTFYESHEMNGACFRVEQIANNCFDFYAAASTAEEARNPSKKIQYTARAHVTGKPDTCPAALSS
jgi:hypothetical protein